MELRREIGLEGEMREGRIEVHSRVDRSKLILAVVVPFEGACVSRLGGACVWSKITGELSFVVVRV